MNQYTLEQAIAAMEKYQQTKAAYDHMMAVLSLDATTAAPGGSWEGRSKTMGVLSAVTYELETNPDIGLWLAVLEANRDQLTAQQRRQAEMSFHQSQITQVQLLLFPLTTPFSARHSCSIYRHTVSFPNQTAETGAAAGQCCTFCSRCLFVRDTISPVREPCQIAT